MKNKNFDKYSEKDNEGGNLFELGNIKQLVDKILMVYENSNQSRKIVQEAYALEIHYIHFSKEVSYAFD